MSDTVRVFVDGRGLDAPAGATALDAVAARSPADADAVRAGRVLITDSRGLAISPDTALFNGAVLRLIPNRERDNADPAIQFGA
jgi:hypothetical protein